MTLLLTSTDVPSDFVYPFEFVRLVELNLLDLEPWRILEGEELLDRLRGLRSRYTNELYIPFARRIDNDDVACWAPEDQYASVLIVHDFASAGWERNERYADVYTWLRQAIEDLIEYGS